MLQAEHLPRRKNQLSMGMFSQLRIWCPQLPQRERGTERLNVGASATDTDAASAVEPDLVCAKNSSAWARQSLSIMTGSR